MRTTLKFDDDVVERARVIAAKRRTAIKPVINEALRAGLDRVGQPAELRRYKTKTHEMGLKAGRNLNNIRELLSQADVEESL